MILVALVVIALAGPSAQTCDDLAACRRMAEAAQQAGDYEAFHDLAWAAYRKGKSNDAALMLLVARAQSLSGRPGDALVMLERIAAVGGSTDVASSDDFARVRALPRWQEVAAKFGAVSADAPAKSDPIPPAKAVPSATEKPVAPAKEPAAPPKPAASPKPETTKPKETAAPKSPAATPPEAAKPANPGTTPAEDPAAKPAAKGGKKDTTPLSFTTVLTPGALAYDAVSKRFIIADRKARRVAVVDEHTGQVATLVGAQGALGEITGMAIDPQQGDLWVVSVEDAQPTLNRLQLISGRVLSSTPLDVPAIVALAFVRGAGLIAADGDGTLWQLRPSGTAQKLASLEYVPRAFGSDASGRLYVSAGTSRLARFAVAGSLRRIDTVDIDRSIPRDAPFAVGGGRLHFVVPVGGSFEIRTVAVK